MAVKKKYKKVLEVYKAYFYGNGRELFFLEKPTLKDLISAFEVKNNDCDITDRSFEITKVKIISKKSVVVHKYYNSDKY